MKKILIMMIAVILLIPANLSTAATNSSYKLIVNGIEIQTSTPPYISGGTTYVPVVAVAKAVGFKVTSSADKSMLYFFHQWPDSGVFAIKPLANFAFVSITGSEDSHVALFEKIPFILNGSTLISLKEIGNFLGAKFSVDSKNKRINFEVSNTSIKNALINRYNSNPITRTSSEIIDLTTIRKPTIDSQQSAVVIYPELWSNDLKIYLGKLTTNQYDTDSIFNEYGTYGSEYQKLSIFNKYGDYGSPYSNESAFNDYAKKPPAIVYNGKVVGYLSTNNNLKGAVTLASLVDWLNDKGF